MHDATMLENFASTSVIFTQLVIGNISFWGFSSLSVLKVICSYEGDFGSLELPFLKTLKIELESYADDDYEDRCYYSDHKRVELLSGCPNLTSLVLIDYFVEDTCIICAPKLENFEFLDDFHWPEITSNKVELPPSLKSIKFRNFLPTVKSSSKFSCLNTVCIEVDEVDIVFGKEGLALKKLMTNFYELLKLFHNATSFTLPLKAMQKMSFVNNAPLCFRKMRHLKLKTNGTKKLIELPIAEFKNMPNLETLVILNEANKNTTLWGFGYC